MRLFRRVAMPAILTTYLSGTLISAKKSANSTLPVPFTLTVPALRTVDNMSGQEPTDKGGVARTLLLADQKRCRTCCNAAAYISTRRSVLYCLQTQRQYQRSMCKNRWSSWATSSRQPVEAGWHRVFLFAGVATVVFYTRRSRTAMYVPLLTCMVYTSAARRYPSTSSWICGSARLVKDLKQDSSR